MTNKKMQLLFDLAEELCWEEYKKCGMATQPYAWAKHEESFIAVSVFGKHSEAMERKLVSMSCY